MLRDEDEYDEPSYDCPVCRRSFGSYARLADHLADHEGPPHCRNCGEMIRGFHRCS